MFTVQEIHDPEAKAALCSAVLRDLPDWFGIEEATQAYIAKCRELPFFAALDEELHVGFVYLYPHNAYTYEVYCMGVLRRRHRQGIGRLLVDAAQEYSRGKGAKFLTVKTLADAHPDEGYRKTRKFYLSSGFLPLEVFPDLWGEQNPCLFLVKCI